MLEKSSTFTRLFAVIRDHLGLNVSCVGPRVHRKLFIGRASVRNCNGRCCRGGTTVSLEERDRILANAAIVREARCITCRTLVSRSGVPGSP